MKCELCLSVITNKEKIFMGCDNSFVLLYVDLIL